MGWSFSLLIVNERAHGILGGFPLHNAVEAHQFAAWHRLGIIRQSSLTYLDRALTPKPSWCGIGAYDRVYLLTGAREITNFPAQRNSEFVKSLRSRHLQAEILICELVSAVNYACYSLYQSGELVRFAALDSDKVHAVEGPSLPEEQKYGFDLLQPGNPPSSLAPMGEAVVFEILARFFGKPFDQYECERLVVELFKR